MAISGLGLHAQIQNNNFMLGGGAAFSQITVAGASTFQADISANAAYLFHFGEVAKNGSLAAGLRPSFTWNPTESVYKGVLFTRYYYHFKTVSPFAEFNLGYRHKNTFDAINQETFSITESFVWGGKLGVAFILARNVTFDTFFFYDKLNSTIHFLTDPPIPSSKTKDKSMGLGLGFQIFL